MSTKTSNKMKDRGRAKIVKAPPPEERLRRETRFIANISFRADLPEVACEPKMLTDPWDSEKLSKFGLTAIEAQPRKDLLVQRGLGVPLNAAHRCREFDIGLEKPEIDPKDLEFLNRDGEDLRIDPEKNTLIRKKGTEDDVSWLMQTQYISSLFAETAAPVSVERQIQTSEQIEAENLCTREGQVEFIEKSFAAKKRPATHPKFPSLKPSQEWEVLPDSDNPGLNFASVLFANNPTEDSSKLSSLSSHYREQIADGALLKITKGKTANDSGQSIVFLAPCDLWPDNVPTPSTSNDDVPNSADYAWVKEYSYSMHNGGEDEKPTYVFQLCDNMVKYIDINTKIVIKKQRREPNMPRASKVTLEYGPAEEDHGTPQFARTRQEDIYGVETHALDEGFLEEDEDYDEDYEGHYDDTME